MYSSAKQELQPVEQRGEGPKLENDFSIIFHIIIIALALTIRHLHGSSKWFVVMMIAVVFCCCYFAIVWHGRLILTWRNHLAFVASRCLGNHRERQDWLLFVTASTLRLTTCMAIYAWQRIQSRESGGVEQWRNGTKILQTHIFFANIPPFITCTYMLYGEWEHNTNLDLICPRAADGKIT